MPNESYQKINWGWLNDYNGYKFAPITFIELLYTEDGTSFYNKYKSDLDSLLDGSKIVSKAKYLVDDNGIGYSIGSASIPVYFKDGIPAGCNNLILNDGIITSKEINGTTINGDTINGDTINFTNPLQITIGNTKKSTTTTNTEILWSHEEIGYADNSSGLLSIGSQLIAGRKVFLNNVYILKEDEDTSRGYYLTDNNQPFSADFVYGNPAGVEGTNEVGYYPNGFTAICYNSAGNLWIGGRGSSKYPHIGETYISAGFKINNDNIAVGNDTIKISIPKCDSTGKWSSVNCDVIHTNNINNYAIPYQNREKNGKDAILPEFNRYYINGNINIAMGYQKGTFPTTETRGRLFAFIGDLPETPVSGKEYDSNCYRFGSIQNLLSHDTHRSRMNINAYLPILNGENFALIYVYAAEDGTCEAGVFSSDSLTTNAGKTESGGNIVFMGAAWNDYAEFRDQIDTIEPGYCVASTNDGKVYKTTEKFLACDGIVSDTYGFAIGRTKTYQTPLAVSGRVLAYYEGNKYDYHAGDTVCAGPEGKVCKMTREEIKEYPDRIIGIVSEIPEYEEWNGKKVNNRIWIKVK